MESKECHFHRVLYSGWIRWVKMELTPHLYTMNRNEWSCISLPPISHGNAVFWHTDLTLDNFSLRRDYDLPVLSELNWQQQREHQSVKWMGYRKDQLGFGFRHRHNICLQHNIHESSVVHLYSCLWVPGTLYPGIKGPEHDADHSPPSSVKAKKTSSLYASTVCTA